MVKKSSKVFQNWQEQMELDSCKFLARQWAFGYVSTASLIKALKRYQCLVKVNS